MKRALIRIGYGVFWLLASMSAFALFLLLYRMIEFMLTHRFMEC
jgi:hypothetical protein